MTTTAQAAAAVIAAALAGRAEPLTTEDAVAVATADGFARADARAGLAWAIGAGLIRRGYGPRRTIWHRLASSPQPAGGLASWPETRSNRGGRSVIVAGEGLAHLSSPATQSNNRKATESAREDDPQLPVDDLADKITITGQLADPQNANFSRPQRQRASSPQLAASSPARSTGQLASSPS